MGFLTYDLWLLQVQTAIQDAMSNLILLISGVTHRQTVLNIPFII